MVTVPVSELSSWVRMFHPNLKWAGFDHGEPISAENTEQEQVDKTLEYLYQIQRTAKPAVSSYGAKHALEKWDGRLYVSNGVFLACALYVGFTVKPTGINGLLNMSKRSMSKLSR